MILVSGSTRTVRTLAKRWPHTLGHLLTPKNRNSVRSLLDTGLLWAVDNGAFSGFDAERFTDLCCAIVGKPRLLWVACPDKVADADATLALFEEWQPGLERIGLPVAFVGQDGQESRPVPWSRFECLFVGGSTRWKLSEHAAQLCDEARRRKKWIHMGRVNSRRRMRVALDFGCHSIDGSSFSMYGDRYIHRSLRWLAQVEHQKVFGF